MAEQEPRAPKEEPRLKVNSLSAVGLFVFDFLKVFIIAVAIIIPIRWFLFQPFVVTGDSMRPNFQNGNYLIIDELSYHFRSPERGEVIVLRFPNDRTQFFIKRIVALPGERIVVDNGHAVVYNQAHPEGITLDETYLPSNNITYGNIDRTLGPDEYFVMGDNRLSSSDSRVWGPLQRKDIIGRVYFRVFPLKELQVFGNPAYNFST